MTDSTLARGARGGAQVAFSQLGIVVVQMASAIVLSRLLAPEFFGLFAMVVVVANLGSLIRDFGLPMASLVTRELSPQIATNIWWLNIGLSLLIAAFFLAITPAIVLFYDEPRLAEIMPVVAAIIVLGGIQGQFKTHLLRAMRFRLVALIDFSAPVAGLVAGVAGALAGWTYQALAAQALAAAAFPLMAYIVASPWRPSRPRRDGATWPVVKSGVHLGVSQLVTFVSQNIDTVMIGAVLGATPLGYYNRAFQFMQRPLGALQSPLTSVVVPTVNRALDQGQSVEAVLLKMQAPITMLLVWVTVVTSATASLWVPMALGPGWEPVVPVLQILAIGGAFTAQAYANSWGYLVRGLTRARMYYSIVSQSGIAVAIAIASFFGIQAVAWAYAVSRVVWWPIGLLWLQRISDQRSWPFVRNSLRTLLAGGVAFASTQALITFGSALTPILVLVSGIALSTAVFVAVIALFPGGRAELRRANRMVRSLLHRS